MIAYLEALNAVLLELARAFGAGFKVAGPYLGAVGIFLVGLSLIVRGWRHLRIER